MWDQICLVGELPKPTVVKLHLPELIQCDTAEGSWQGGRCIWDTWVQGHQ